MTLQNSYLTFEYRDEFQRHSIAEKVILLLKSDIEVSPMVLNGGWGTGKSEFCHKLINLMESDTSDQTRIVYVDAFKADHADDPLMTIFAAILNILPEVDRPTIIEKAIPALKFGTKTLLKGGLNWVLRQDSSDLADDFEEELKKAGDELINKNVERVLQAHVEAEQSIEMLKVALESIAKDNPVIIVVDELDRCRPNFALSMLESIKHIFNVDGVQFLLVTNTEQLKESISHCYGAIDNAARYLEKFINYQFTLANSYIGSDQSNVYAPRKLLVNLIENSSKLEGTSVVEEGVALFMNELVEHEQLSLRDVESLVKNIEIYNVLTNGQELPPNMNFARILLKMLGVFLFTHYSEQVKKLLDGQFTPRIFMEILFEAEKFPPFRNLELGHKDVVAAMLTLDSGESGEQYFEKNSVDEWKGYISQYFRGPNGFHSVGDKIKYVSKVISTLTLSN